MSYQVSTRANHVVVGDQVHKDRSWRLVTEVTTEPGDTFDAKATVVTLVFGNGSTIPLYADDYVTVRRSSSATTPKRVVGVEVPGLEALSPYADVPAVVEVDGETDEDEDEGSLFDEDDESCCAQDYGQSDGSYGHAPWCVNK